MSNRVEADRLRLSPLLGLVWLTLTSRPRDEVPTVPSSDSAGASRCLPCLQDLPSTACEFYSISTHTCCLPPCT